MGRGRGKQHQTIVTLLTLSLSRTHTHTLTRAQISVCQKIAPVLVPSCPCCHVPAPKNDEDDSARNRGDGQRPRETVPNDCHVAHPLSLARTRTRTHAHAHAHARTQTRAREAGSSALEALATAVAWASAAAEGARSRSGKEGGKGHGIAANRPRYEIVEVAPWGGVAGCPPQPARHSREHKFPCARKLHLFRSPAAPVATCRRSGARRPSPMDLGRGTSPRGGGGPRRAPTKEALTEGGMCVCQT